MLVLYVTAEARNWKSLKGGLRHLGEKNLGLPQISSSKKTKQAVQSQHSAPPPQIDIKPLAHVQWNG